MEVFLFVSSEEEMSLLEHTMLAWETIDYAFPVNVVQLPEHRFEVKRRVLADQMAQDSHYVLADLGCVPDEGRALLGAVGKMKPEDGMIGFSDGVEYGCICDGILPRADCAQHGRKPSGIRILRKGIVKKWPAQNSTHYDQEHAFAVQQAGYRVTIWPTTYKRILAC